MKELSIEEKAKRYDEAIERANELNYVSDKNSLQCKTVEHIFPELKESEDERMMRVLIGGLKSYIDMYSEWYDGVSTSEIIAWLEKQGEQKPVLDVEIPFGAEDSELKDVTYDIPKGYHAEIEDNKVVIKKGEQKPVKIPKFKAGDFIQFNGMGHTRYTVREVCGLSHYINTCNKRMDMSYTDANFELVEQKPAEWSEENESMYRGLHNLIYSTPYCDSRKEFSDWLKSLKERVQLQKQEWKQENTGDLTDFENVMMHIGISFFGQHAGLDPNDTNAIKEQANILLELVPKQEWSKEDETILDNLIWALKEDMVLANDRDEYVNWLKSLRPQNQWKPSDEQMEALEHATMYNTLNVNDAVNLATLYNDLKKLKG